MHLVSLAHTSTLDFGLPFRSVVAGGQLILGSALQYLDSFNQGLVNLFNTSAWCYGITIARIAAARNCLRSSGSDEANLIGLPSVISITMFVFRRRSPSLSRQSLSSIRISLTASVLNFLVRPIGPTPVNISPCQSRIRTSVLPARHEKNAPIIASPIKIKGVRNSHKKTVKPTPIGLPLDIGAGSQFGGRTPSSESVDATASATKMETIPFQNAAKKNVPIAPAIDRCDAPIRVPIPVLRFHVPAGGFSTSTVGSIPDPCAIEQSLCARLHARQNAISALTLMSSVAITAWHLGQVGVITACFLRHYRPICSRH